MSIQEHLNKIRNAVYGHEVRESIAKGIETAYDDASENGNANMEVKLARGTNPNLNARLNKMEDTDRQTTAQLAQKASKEEVGEVANDVTTTNNRIDKIISTPTTISEQEIIDARGGKASLGAKIGSIDSRISEQKKLIYDHLYRFGNEFLEKTNGWMEAYKAGSVSGVITKETDHLNISFTNSGGVGDLGVTTSKEIDLTYIDTLYVDWEQTVDSLGIRANILISKYRTQPRSVYDTVSVVNDKFERKISELDVSGFTGLYYIRVHAGNTSSSGSVDLNVYNIYTDKEIVKIDGLLEVNKELDLTNEEIGRVKNDVDSHIPLVFDLLYRYGEEFTDKTDGWMEAYQQNVTVGDLAKETDRMNINFESSGAGNFGVVTTKKIDLSFIDTIYVDWEQTVDGLSQRIYLIVSEFRTQPHNIFDLRAEEINLVGRRTTALDVSSLTGEYYVRINAFTNSTSTLNMNIYNIYTDKEVKENGLLSIPTHWETEYNDSVNKVKNLQNNVGVNGTSFGFITDTHWGLNAKKSHVLLSQLLNDCDIKYYFDGGDIIAGLGIETKEMIIADIEEQKQVFDSISDKRLLVEGNHDAAYSDGGVDYAGNLTLEEFYSIFFRSQSLNDNVVFGNDGTYFYVDDVSQKIRYIGLNALDTPYDVNKMHVFCFRDEQIQWLVNNALEIPSDEWSVVVCSHNIPIENQKGIIVNADVLLNVFNAFKNKTSYSGDGTNATYPTSVNVDFTNRGGNFVCWIGGHVHYDYLEVANGINLVTTLNDSLQIQTNAPVKTQGTDTEQSFDIFTINKITRTVDVTRVGAGTDRTFTY